jgi:hypothetical protein
VIATQRLHHEKQMLVLRKIIETANGEDLFTRLINRKIKVSHGFS